MRVKPFVPIRLEDLPKIENPRLREAAKPTLEELISRLNEHLTHISQVVQNLNVADNFEGGKLDG